MDLRGESLKKLVRKENLLKLEENLKVEKGKLLKLKDNILVMARTIKLKKKEEKKSMLETNLKKITTEKVSGLNKLGLSKEETKKRIDEFEKLLKQANNPEDHEKYTFWINHYKSALE